MKRSLSTISILLLSFSASLLAQSDGVDYIYLLSVGDRVSLEVHDQSDLKSTQEIDEEGNVRLKYIGIVKFEGLSIREAEKAVEAEYLNQRYLRHPNASVQILDYSSKPVIVRGAVFKPGLVELDRYPQGLEINQVIAMAGGFRDVAKESSVLVIRESADGNSKVFEVDLSSKSKKKKSARFERFMVLPRDIIEVGETTF